MSDSTDSIEGQTLGRQMEEEEEERAMTAASSAPLETQTHHRDRDQDQGQNDEVNIVVPRFGHLLNRASFRVSLGSSSYASVMYCGRRLGPDAIPGSDGRCGPDDGPQCDDCKALMYRGGGRLEVLRRTVPALASLVSFLLNTRLEDEECKTAETGQRQRQRQQQKQQEVLEERVTTQILVLALRQSGGVVTDASTFLCNRLPGLKALSSPELALPPLPTVIAPSSSSSPPSSGNSDPVDQVENMDDIVLNMCETLGIDPETSEAALRRHGNDVQRAAAFVLDEPETAATAARELLQERERRRDEEEELQRRHERALEMACVGTTIKTSSSPSQDGGDDDTYDERQRRHLCSLKRSTADMIESATSFRRLSVEAEEAVREDKKDKEIGAIHQTRDENTEGGGGQGSETEKHVPKPCRVIKVAQRKEDDKEIFAVSGHLMVRVSSPISGSVAASTASCNNGENVESEPCNHGGVGRCELEGGVTWCCCVCADKRGNPPTCEGYPRKISRVGDTVHESRHEHYCPSCRDTCESKQRASDSKLSKMTTMTTTTYCLLCSGAVPSPECGNYVCQLCNICEGCIQSPFKDGGGDISDTTVGADVDPNGTGSALSIELRGPTYRCPALLNGSHLHVHPLTYGHDRRRTCHCDIGASDCSDVLWNCAQCDFDACFFCMARPAPEGYDRLAGKMETEDDGDDENEEEDEEDSDDESDNEGEEGAGNGMRRIGARPFDHVAAERRTAARWEGAAVTDPPPGETVVGTGEVTHGDAFVATPLSGQRGGHCHRKEARRKLKGAETSSVAEAKLAENAEEALELFRLGKWRTDSTGYGGGRKNSLSSPRSSESASASIPTQCIVPPTWVVPAADLAHAEDLLHRAQIVQDGYLINQELHRAVASGRLDLAGSLLLVEAYAPVVDRDAGSDAATATAHGNGNNGGNSNAAVETGSNSIVENSDDAKDDQENDCWCGLPINFASSPDGSVGCLGGHAMHPSCASDLLLSGGSCPTCRMHLYYPRVPEAEGRIATELVEAELRRSKMWKCTADEEDGGDSTQVFAVDDFVLIDSNPKKCCDEQMGEPRSGGWFDDMGSSCGKVGRITELIREGGAGVEGDVGDGNDNERGRIVAARVRTRADEHNLVRIRRRSNYQCKNCSMYGPSRETGRRKCSRCRLCERCCLRSREDRLCSQSHNGWTWSPSLLRKTIPDLDDSALLDPEEAAARNAEGHVMRLRAELKAVAAAREGLRAKTSGLKMPLMVSTSEVSKGTPQLQLHKDAIDALCHLWGKVSFSDWTWARHLLTLAHWWDDPHDVATVRRARAELCHAAREGDLDSVARAVRRRNATRMAERLRWEDAVCATGEYVVSPTARVELRAFPADSAPRTGFSLHPESSFRSRREMLDSEGNLWLQVDPKSFPSHDGGENNGKVVADLSNQMTSKAIVGARVRRGPDWKWNDQDGGEGNVGVIVQVLRSGMVSVRWDAGSSARQYEYRAGNGHHDLLFVGAAPQAPQGWLSVRPAGHGSPAVVWRSRSALRCFCCGDGLVPPRSDRGRYASARGAAIKEGDKLLVAATLEAVVVKVVSGGRVRCAFAFKDGPVPNYVADIGQDECFDVWFRLEDLVLPKGRGEVWGDDEVVRIKGQLRTRREVVLMCDGDEFAARRMWDEAKKRSKSGKNHVEEGGLSFASCIRGHFLHARCLQGALLAGRECPAIGCKEPLCVPRVKRLRGDDTCCGADGTDITAAAAAAEVEEEADLLRTAEDLIQRSRASDNSSSAASDDARMSDAGLPDLKMCPACCSGPLINQNCSDMKAHHGQCSRVAIRGSSGDEVPCTSGGMFSVSAMEIAELIKHMSSSQVVTDVLPKCPTHKVPIMFNGCLCCGNLFTDTDWDEMPKWDPKAKSLLELDNKKRKAADLLAKKVRTEVAHYQFERDQFDRFEAMCKLCSDGSSSDDVATLPPLPPPALKYSLRGCGPSCDLQHFREGECLVCGRNWGVHSGHTCPGGRTRGSWVVR